MMATKKELSQDLDCYETERRLSFEERFWLRVERADWLPERDKERLCAIAPKNARRFVRELAIFDDAHSYRHGDKLERYRELQRRRASFVQKLLSTVKRFWLGTIH